MPGYPNDRLIPHLPDLLHAGGFRVQTDEYRRFGYRLHTPADADLLLNSLYLPVLRPARLCLAGIYLRTLTRGEVEIPVPLRRIVATTVS